MLQRLRQRYTFRVNQCNWHFGILEFSSKSYPSLDFWHINNNPSIDLKLLNLLLSETFPCIWILRPRLLDSSLKLLKTDTLEISFKL